MYPEPSGPTVLAISPRFRTPKQIYSKLGLFADNYNVSWCLSDWSRYFLLCGLFVKTSRRMFNSRNREENGPVNIIAVLVVDHTTG